MREMKDSGVAWIGEIPEQWDISTINSLYTLRATPHNCQTSKNMI